MSGAIPPLPQHAFMAWCSVKAQGLYYDLDNLLKTYTRKSRVELRIFYLSWCFVIINSSNARFWRRSWGSSTTPHTLIPDISQDHLKIILPLLFGLTSGCFPKRFPHRNCACISRPPTWIYVQPILTSLTHYHYDTKWPKGILRFTKYLFPLLNWNIIIRKAIPRQNELKWSLYWIIT
jgi:hypothetical protein